MKPLTSGQDDTARSIIPQMDTSLFRLSIVSVVTHIWKGGPLNDELQLIFDTKKTLAEDRVYLIRQAENIVKQLEIPTIILEEVLMITEWISNDFLIYLDGLMKNELYTFTGEISNIIKNIRWDLHGTINEIETFKNMKYTNCHYNYLLAAIFCIEKEIPIMWEKCPHKSYLIDTIQSGEFSYRNFIIYYWTVQLAPDEVTDQLIQYLHDPDGILTNIVHGSYYLSMLVISLHIFNAHSFKYFWHLVDENERHIAFSILCTTYSSENLFLLDDDYIVRHSVSIILFILLQINEQQRLIFIQKCFYQIITQFWEYWPIHHTILPFFKSIIEFIDEKSYKKLINRLLRKKGSFCPRNRLLLKIWLSSPPHLQCLISETEKKEIFLDEGESRLPKDCMKC